MQLRQLRPIQTSNSWGLIPDLADARIFAHLSRKIAHDNPSELLLFSNTLRALSRTSCGFQKRSFTQKIKIHLNVQALIPSWHEAPHFLHSY
jgi:hypothetical protein